ncbi:hypothetical protein KAR48_03065 [bacterium]|nr:hypothetical protein [bacterium]
MSLTSHALVHGGIVWFVTGNMTLGLIETFWHWLVDFAKCENWTGLHTDQLLHMLSKAFYVLAISKGWFI